LGSDGDAGCTGVCVEDIAAVACLGGGTGFLFARLANADAPAVLQLVVRFSGLGGRGSGVPGGGKG
jgi:hypothetical protein